MLFALIQSTNVQSCSHATAVFKAPVKSIKYWLNIFLFCGFIGPAFIFSGCAHQKHIPKTIETVSAKDGSVWERVSAAGFGNDDNMGVVAMEEYKGRLYALTRNDAAGTELWRTSGSEWEQVLFPNGVGNGIYGNELINNLFSDMIVFKGKLYLGFSSGLQGATRKSSGCEIWRYDGSDWEPVISDKKDTEASGTISAITGCKENDADTTAKIIDKTKNWEPNRWAGGVLQITSGDGKYRRFDIVGNTADTYIIQQNEIAGKTGEEQTVCESPHYINPFPPYEYDQGTVRIGDAYEIGTGHDENGFGDYWNRAVNSMAIINKKLYVGTGLNYEYGSQVWYTEDGDTWHLTYPTNSFDVFHSDPQYPSSKKPVIVTALSLCPSSVSGSEILYAGGTGSSGNAGRCARMAKLTGNTWQLMVDASVDKNDTGTNENGFGDGMECTMFNGNFMPWSLEDFKGKLYVGINSIAGARVLYTPTGSSEDGSWFYSAGGDSGIPNGFDGVKNKGASAFMKMDFYQNIVANLFSFENYLYAGLISMYVPPLGATEEHLAGAHIWKTGDGITWEQITADGFGDNRILTFEAFTEFNDSLYVSGSKTANSVIGGLGGAKIFRSVKKSTTTRKEAVSQLKIGALEAIFRRGFTPQN